MMEEGGSGGWEECDGVTDAGDDIDLEALFKTFMTSDGEWCRKVRGCHFTCSC